MTQSLKKDHPLWTASEIAAVTQGRVIGQDFAINGISIDTRDITAGDLFIALKGHHGDGHDFAEQALRNGAAGVLIHSDIVRDHAVRVDDTFRALHDLGAGARARSHAYTVAVTGSVGKTSVKAMLQDAFTFFGKTHSAAASLNNHWGVPLSLARLPTDALYAIFEIGMNHAGEITPLSKLVSPNVAIITTVAAAHIEHFGSIEGIALAKAEIFQGMDAQGTAILPRDNDQYSVLLAEARTQGIGRIITFGTHDEADIRMMSYEDGLLTVSFNGIEKTFSLGIKGRHQAMNVLPVLGALHAAGLDWTHALSVFSNMVPVTGRGNRQAFHLKHLEAHIDVIDETHNASPIAVEAALSVLAEEKTQGRRIVVLGDMLELGAQSPALHAGLSRAVLAAKPDRIYLCGPMMAHLAQALELPETLCRHYADSLALTEALIPQLQAHDLVLVKGSRGSQMKRVIDAMARMAQSENTENNNKTMRNSVTTPTG